MKAVVRLQAVMRRRQAVQEVARREIEIQLIQEEGMAAMRLQAIVRARSARQAMRRWWAETKLERHVANAKGRRCRAAASLCAPALLSPAPPATPQAMWRAQMPSESPSMVGLQLQSAGKEESLTAVLAYEGPGAVAADAALVVSLFSSTNHLASAATGLQTSSASDSRWKRAKAAGHAGVMTARWHKDVDRVWKRLCLACLSSHTLCAGILTRGSAGYTRAQ